MRIFIRKFIGFAGFIFISLLLFQGIISFLLIGKNIRGHDNLEKTSNINADLVFLGSSRCWVHFDPVFFDSTFKIKSVNIGVDGHTEIQMAIIRLKDYLSRNQPPKYAILNIDPFIGAGSKLNNINFVHKDAFARYSFLPTNKNLLIVNFFKFNLFEKYIPLYAVYKYKLLSDCISIKKNNSYTKHRYERHDEKWDTISSPVTDTLKKSFYDIIEKKMVINSLVEFKELCSKNNIKLLCIQTPVYKIIQDENIFEDTKNLCKALEIPFIDANIEFIRNEIKYFYNSNHLNTDGVLALNLELKNNSLLLSFFGK